MMERSPFAEWLLHQDGPLEDAAWLQLAALHDAPFLRDAAAVTEAARHLRAWGRHVDASNLENWWKTCPRVTA